MNNNIYKKLIKYGNIQDNYLVDFPQHVLTTTKTTYKLEVNSGFKIKLVIPINNYVFCLPLVYLDPEKYSYNFIVDWGDNSSNKVIGFDDINKSHIYTKAGTYIVTINGDCFGFNNKAFKDKTNKNNWEYLTDIIGWGTLDLSLLNYRILSSYYFIKYTK